MKVLVVTEIRLYRDGVADALRRMNDVDSIDTAATGAAAVLAARRSGCDVVLLDMALARSTHTITALLTVRSDLKVVALGVPEDGPEVVACAEAGVFGYISRDAGLDDVGEALRAAARGEAPLPGRGAGGLVNHIACHARVELSDAGHRLTAREREVARLLHSGMTNRQIARALNLQLSTVKNHVHSVLSKLGATGRSDVHAFAHAIGV
jgi:DNA-binding NarL/FixJ family response regulator